MRVHDVERHLAGIEVEAPLLRHGEHLQVDARILVAGKADVAELALFLGLHEAFHGPALGEDPVGIIEAQDLVVLHEVDMVGAQAQERLVDLLEGFLLGPPVHLGHQEDLVAVAILRQGRAHAQFRAAFVVVPTIVHEGDAPVDPFVDQPGRLVVGDGALAEVEPAHADGRDFLVRLAEVPVEHLAPALARVGDEGQIGRVLRPRVGQAGIAHGRPRRAGRSETGAEGSALEEVAAFHVHLREDRFRSFIGALRAVEGSTTAGRHRSAARARRAAACRRRRAAQAAP